MSYAAIEWARGLPVAGSGKALLLLLAEHADDAGVCWPGQARLAAMAGISDRQVRTWLARFDAAGWLERRRRGPTSTVYRLCLEVKPGASVGGGHERKPEERKPVDKSLPVTPTSGQERKCTSGHDRKPASDKSPVELPIESSSSGHRHRKASGQASGHPGARNSTRPPDGTSRLDVLAAALTQRHGLATAGRLLSIAATKDRPAAWLNAVLRNGLHPGWESASHPTAAANPHRATRSGEPGSPDLSVAAARHLGERRDVARPAPPSTAAPPSGLQGVRAPAAGATPAATAPPAATAARDPQRANDAMTTLAGRWALDNGAAVPFWRAACTGPPPTGKGELLALRNFAAWRRREAVALRAKRHRTALEEALLRIYADDDRREAALRERFGGAGQGPHVAGMVEARKVSA